MPVMPGAEPFHHEGGRVGALVCHGFTGTPQSMRPWAEHLAEAGLTVALPRLPGHGTTLAEANLTHWEDWYAELDRHLTLLKERCDDVFVMGLSMGGTLAIRLAEEHGDAIAGLVLVNPSLLTKRPDRFVLPLVRWALPTMPGIASDIKKPGVTELAYDKVAGEGRLPAQPAVGHDPRRPGQGHPADPGLPLDRGPRRRARLVRAADGEGVLDRRA